MYSFGLISFGLRQSAILTVEVSWSEKKKNELRVKAARKIKRDDFSRSNNIASFFSRFQKPITQCAIFWRRD